MNKQLTQAIAEGICKDRGIIRLNLGCGFKKKDGFINIDAVDLFNPDYSLHIYSFGNDKGIGKPYMTLKEVKDKIHKLLP